MWCNNLMKKYISEQPLREGITHTIREDVFYYFMETSWSKLLGLLFIFYVSSNLFFGALYYFMPGAIGGKENILYSDAFFFSVQTMSTIGYGALHPASFEGNVLVTIEAGFGIILMASITGLIFAKLSKPHAKIRFTKKALISTFDGERCLSFRMGNIRGNDIVEAKVTVSALIDETTLEGKKIRKVYDLPLRRSHTPFFKLTWSIFHPLNEFSPIQNYPECKERIKAVVVTVTGHDGSFSSTVYSRHLYTVNQFVEGKYFSNVVEDLPDGGVRIDYNKFDELS